MEDRDGRYITRRVGGASMTRALPPLALDAILFGTIHKFHFVGKKKREENLLITQPGPQLLPGDNARFPAALHNQLSLRLILTYDIQFLLDL